MILPPESTAIYRGPRLASAPPTTIYLAIGRGSHAWRFGVHLEIDQMGRSGRAVGLRCSVHGNVRDAADVGVSEAGGPRHCDRGGLPRSGGGRVTDIRWRASGRVVCGAQARQTSFYLLPWQRRYA